MNEPVKFELKAFPSTYSEALALAYVNAQDLSGKTPADVYRIYKNAYDEIEAERKKVLKEEKSEKKSHS